MGRPEEELAADGSARHELARRLRELRHSAGLTYVQMAHEGNYSKSTFQEACNGRTVPSKQLLTQFVSLCGGTPEQWMALRDAAVTGRPLRDLASGTLPDSPVTADRTTGPVGPKVADSVDPDGAIATGDSTSAVISRPLRTPPHRRVLIVVGLGLAAVLVVALTWVVVAAALDSDDAAAEGAGAAQPTVLGSSDRAGEGVHEQQYNRNGAPTFGDPFGVADSGPKVPFQQVVLVSCKVHAPVIPSVSPDGYWYRLADPPWNDRYYAAANTFLNGDQPDAETYVHNTNWSIPDCVTEQPSSSR